jgi:hypothetical protein
MAPFLKWEEDVGFQEQKTNIHGWPILHGVGRRKNPNAMHLRRRGL